MPPNFQHISHVGWDPNHGFDLENVDPNLKKFFHKAGVDERALQDKDTRGKFTLAHGSLLIHNCLQSLFMISSTSTVEWRPR